MTNENPLELIDELKGKYHFLSNFFYAPVSMGREDFQHNEGAFQWSKIAPGPEGDWFREKMLTLGPKDAKILGRKAPLREDWEDIKYDKMYEINFLKFYQNKDLAVKLIQTGDAYIQEGNWWNDLTWGVDLKYDGPWQERKGGNWLGLILMQVRQDLINRIEFRPF